MEYKQFGFVLLSVCAAGILQLAGFKHAADALLIVAALANVVPLVWGMIQDLRSGIYGVDILAATAILAAVAFQEYWAAMVIVFMLTGGESLEDYANNRAKSELSALLDRAPQKAHVLRGNKEVEVPVAKVEAGDKLIVRPGEVVPVDAIIIEGSADLDESSLTGESLPVNKKVGDDILSGAVLLDRPLTIKALRAARDSQYQQIIKLVKIAETNRSPFVRMADRYSIPFTLIAFTIALGAWALSGESIRFLQVLVVATPCPLILGAPIAIISGMSRAAKHGIIMKTGGALEQLAAAKTIGFDKTGTLTVGKPTIQQITAFGSFTQKDVIGLAAALEQKSNHILAKAVVEKSINMKVKLPKVKNVEEVSGKGLSASFGGKTVTVGRPSLLETSDVDLPKQFSINSITQTAAVVVVDNALVGVISFEDAVRTETKKTLTNLRGIGIKHMLMVTGDNKKTAQQVASKLGIDHVVADALPADKIRAIEDLHYKPVAFIGDGVNDAPVLATADVGIALGARGSTAASESADIVIMTDSLAQVATGLAISKRTVRIARQSILSGIFLSIILMFVFATGKFKPIYGAALQEVVDVVVIFYALRAHSEDKKIKQLARV